MTEKITKIDSNTVKVDITTTKSDIFSREEVTLRMESIDEKIKLMSAKKQYYQSLIDVMNS